MLDVLTDAFLALQAEASSYPELVRIWMRIRAISFIVSVVFIRSQSGARWILAAFLVNITGLIAGKVVFPDLSRTLTGTGIHLIFWPIALWAVWRPAARPSLNSLRGVFDRFYGAWLVWISVLLSISLVLDARTMLLLVFA